MPTQTGIISLPNGQAAGSVTFETPFTALPIVEPPSIQNTSSDNPKLILVCLVTAVSLTGFSYQLSAAPDTDNYQLAYEAEGALSLASPVPPPSPTDQSGIRPLAVSATTGTVTFDRAFDTRPAIESVGVQNTSSDDPKQILTVTVTGITLTGFTYQLSAAPTTSNYQIVFEARGRVALPPKAAAKQGNLEAPEIPGCDCNYITEQEVREYVEDYDTQQGMLGVVDYDFSPKAILSAMQACAREYNGINPSTDFVRPNALPKFSNLFFDGIAYFLYLRAIQHEKRHDVPYKAGSVEVDIASRRIAHYEGAVKMFGERFATTAKQNKRLLNYRRMSGTVG